MRGAFVQPGIHFMQKFEPNSAYQGNVLFGPDIAIYAYDNFADAINWANATDARLVNAYVGDPSLLPKYRDAIAAPNVTINKPTIETDHFTPLPGTGYAANFVFERLGHFMQLARLKSSN